MTLSTVLSGLSSQKMKLSLVWLLGVVTKRQSGKLYTNSIVTAGLTLGIGVNQMVWLWTGITTRLGETLSVSDVRLT